MGDSIPALITELCLLLIQLELSLLMIAAELITLINLTYSYFDKSDQTWLVIYVSSLFVPFISAKLTGLPPYSTFAELDQLFPF